MVAEMIGYPQGIQGGGQKDRYQHRYEISGNSASAASTRTWQVITSAVHTWTNLRSTQAEMILHHPWVTVCGLLDRWKDAVGTSRAPCSCQRIFITLLQGVAFRSNSEQEGAASRRLEREEKTRSLIKMMRGHSLKSGTRLRSAPLPTAYARLFTNKRRQSYSEVKPARSLFVCEFEFHDDRLYDLSTY